MTERMLQGSRALVLGGTYGIGAAIAADLAGRGARVAISARTSPTPTQGGNDPADGRPDAGQHLFIAGDMSSWEGIREVVQTATERLDGLQILVVSGRPRDAGGKLFLATDPESFEGYFRARTLTRFWAARAAADVMRDQEYGKIIFLTTDAGRVPTPAESLIGASAAAVIFGTRALAQELARVGIRVNTVSLSLTRDTPAYARYSAGKGSGEPLWRAFEKLEARAQFGLNTAQDVAEAVAFLAGPGSDKISGATISLNGGVSFPG